MHARVWRLAGPMILSNVSIPLLGMVDTAVVGHLAQPYYIGAVAIGALIFNFVYWGFGFLRMGTTGLTAQAFGAEDSDELRASLGRAMVTAVVLAALLLALQGVVVRIALGVVDASPEVESLAGVYFAVRIWSAPATLANYALLGWFIGMQNTRVPLALLLVTNLVNIALDLLFVVGMGMNVDGVALASVIADYAGVAVGLALAAAELKRHPGVWRAARLRDPQRLRQMLTVNHNIFVRTLALIFSFAFFTAQGARQGDVILAANAVLLNFQTFMAYALDGFAHAAEALVGRAMGRAQRADFTSAVRATGQWSGLVAVGFCAIYALAGTHVIALLTDIPEVRRAAAVFLPWAVASPLVSVWSFWFDGIFIGATRAAEMRNTMLASTFGVYLPAWYLLQPLGNHGLWLAFLLFMAARGASMWAVFRRIDRSGGFLSPFRHTPV
jgi:MATE family multidrug resistance protein